VESVRSLMKQRLTETGLWPFRSGRRAVTSKLDAREAYRLVLRLPEVARCVLSTLEEVVPPQRQLTITLLLTLNIIESS
jgi:hypothetical protein